ncbi:hypothetical protein CJ195_22340 [Bacillus sp. UMB0899]|nr:hypothetical protein CJ195_22340 [Bacillus sp. UMB0899]
MDNNKKLTTRETLIGFLANEWGLVNENGVHTIEELKALVEEKVIQLSKEITASNLNIELEAVQPSDIIDDWSVEAFNLIEFPILNINEVSTMVVEKYTDFEYSNVYTTLHKIISSSNNLLIKPVPGNFCINYDALNFYGTQRKLSRSTELQLFIESVEESWEQLESLFKTLRESSEFIITDTDKDLLSKEWKLLSEAINHIRMYRLK